MSDWSRAVLWTPPVFKGEIMFTFALQSHCTSSASNIAFFFPCMVIIGFSCELAGFVNLILCLFALVQS